MRYDLDQTKKTSVKDGLALGGGVIIGFIIAAILLYIISSIGIVGIIEIILIIILIFITRNMEINTLNYFLNGVYMGLSGPASIKVLGFIFSIIGRIFGLN